jgi:hypothetical protein
MTGGADGGYISKGGAGGGGHGGRQSGSTYEANGISATVNTGGGGGGAGGFNTNGGGAGASGTVILSYPDSYAPPKATTGSPLVFLSGSGGVGSISFNGSTDYITVSGPTSAASGTPTLSDAFQIGAGNFTVEGWVNASTLGTAMCLLENRPSNTALGINMFLNYSNAGQLEYRDSTGAVIGATNYITANTWNHWALVRVSSTITLYINGVASGTATKSTDLTDRTWIIGRDQGGGYFFSGYMSNMRYIKGVGVYTSNFSVPTTSLPCLYGTQLLMRCVAPVPFADDSLQGFNPKPAGSCAWNASSPFTPRSGPQNRVYAWQSSGSITF